MRYVVHATVELVVVAPDGPTARQKATDIICNGTSEMAVFFKVVVDKPEEKHEKE